MPTLAPYAEHRGASFTTIGLIVSAYGLALLLFRLPLGLYSDRIGKRRVFITTGLVGAGLAAVGLATSPVPEWMIAARFLSGLSACAWVTFTILFASYYPSDQTPRAMGHIAFVNGISIMVASFFGGWLADTYGWLAPFWASAIFGCVGCAMSFFIHETGPTTRRTITLADTKRVLRHPTLIWVSVVGAFGMYTVFASSFGFLPNYAVTLGATKTQLGLLSTVTLLCSSFAGLSASRIALPTLGPKGSVVVAYSIVTVAVTAIPYATAVEHLFVLQAIGGFCRGTAYPILMAMVIHDVPEQDKATAMGFYQSVYSSGMFLGPIGAGYIGDEVGYPALFISSAAVGFVAVLAALKLPKQLSD